MSQTHMSDVSQSKINEHVVMLVACTGIGSFRLLSTVPRAPSGNLELMWVLFANEDCFL
jgi:hypothetical protein